MSEELSFSDALNQAMGEIMDGVSPEEVGDIHIHDGDETECTCPVVDDDDVDMEIHVTMGEEPENGLDYQVKAVVYSDGFLPLLINDTPVQIPWRIRIVKLG